MSETTNSESLFEAFLNQHDDRAWNQIIASLLPAIHEVDRAATRIWFYFYPLALRRALLDLEDVKWQPEYYGQKARELAIQGSPWLGDHIDTSHRFLYGHRYWPQVKEAVIHHASSNVTTLDLARQIREVANGLAEKLGIDSSLAAGITAVAFMTLQQTGAKAFREWPGKIDLDRKILSRSPDQILKARERDDSQGLFGFLRGDRKEYTVTFDETSEDSRFKLIHSQHLTTAAAADKRPYHLRDSRCTVNEGPIPVQCRSASCGTCWVGILGGAEKLSPVSQIERRAMKKFGYIETEETNPVIRLACQSQAFGAVSIVIPPWNGILGKVVREKEEANAG
jgi:ferredoxin